MRELGGSRHDDFLNDEMIELREHLLDVVRVGIRLRRILANDEQRREVAASHGFQHLREVPAVLRLNARIPGSLKPSASLGIEFDVLEPRQFVGYRTHVAAALHVVLST